MSRKIYRSYDGRWNHTERRVKVTFSEFLAARLNAIPVPYGSFEAARLFGSPVNMARMELREQVRGNAKKLASKTAKFLTMHAEYAARRSFAKARLEKEPDLQTRLNRLSGSSPPSRPVNLSKWPSGLPITFGAGFKQEGDVYVVPHAPPVWCPRRTHPAFEYRRAA